MVNCGEWQVVNPDETNQFNLNPITASSNSFGSVENNFRPMMNHTTAFSSTTVNRIALPKSRYFYLHMENF